MTAQWDADKPIYLQLYQQVLSRILDGYIKEGEALPSVRKVASQYQLNPITISKAYQMLQDEQVVEKQRGKGLFVKNGAQENMLTREREAFLTHQWPQILKQITRLKLSAEQLLATEQGDKTMIEQEKALISIANLNKFYGSKQVVSEVNLRVEAGQILGLVGPNGAGKTTCLQAMLGLSDFEGDIDILWI